MRPRVSESCHAPEPSVVTMGLGDSPVWGQCSVVAHYGTMQCGYSAYSPM